MRLPSGSLYKEQKWHKNTALWNSIQLFWNVITYAHKGLSPCNMGIEPVQNPARKASLVFKTIN